MPRSARQGGPYRAYVPDALRGRRFQFDGQTAADIADAERLIATFESNPGALADTEALARLLLRAESVASSHIEGLVIGARRLLKADAARQEGESPADVTAAEVLANIDAMAFAMHAIHADSIITPELLLAAHKRLLRPTRLSEHGGTFRTVQNWIGGSAYNPCAAVFVPPPPEMVADLLADLCAFCNTDSIPAVAQAAIAHAQFENIHPFVDGNGRIGRLLIHLVLRRRALTHAVSPPVSLALATRSGDYIDGLRRTAHVGSPDAPEAVGGMNHWIGTFAAACTRATLDATAFERRIRQIQDEWRSRLGPVRRDASALKLIDALPGAPITTVAAASRLIGRSLPSTIEGMQRLVKAGIVKPIHPGRQRRQAFEAGDIINAFGDLERQLASPLGDTHIEPPTRPVSARPFER